MAIFAFKQEEGASASASVRPQSSGSTTPAEVIPVPSWRDRLGYERNWFWRGWQTRYTYLRPADLDRRQAPPLILLHGFGASIGHWRHNLSVLAQSHPVYALDMLGFGASQKVIAPYSIQFWVEQVYHFWKAFIGRPVVLIGNSIGSLVCLAAAAQYPEMVAGIAMLSLPDTSIREEMLPATVRPIVAAIEGLFTSPLLLKALFYYVRRPKIVRPWAAIAYANSVAVTDELVEILVGPAQEKGAAGAFAAIIKAMTSRGFGPKVKAVLPGLDIPILLIWGQQDRMIPPLLGRQFANYNPRVKLVELEEAGHCPHDEVPDRVNAEILTWLAASGLD
uniref:Alpha/beta hydrolase fold protein n=1 Tax=Cyanothece sp. (strain PCC 7425 / ATCC 29141) TaxID=395961 RepID=B8HT37_CYAP4